MTGKTDMEIFEEHVIHTDDYELGVRPVKEGGLIVQIRTKLSGNAKQVVLDADQAAALHANVLDAIEAIAAFAKDNGAAGNTDLIPVKQGILLGPTHKDFDRTQDPFEWLRRLFLDLEWDSQSDEDPEVLDFDEPSSERGVLVYNTGTIKAWNTKSNSPPTIHTTSGISWRTVNTLVYWIITSKPGE